MDPLAAYWDAMAVRREQKVPLWWIPEEPTAPPLPPDMPSFMPPHLASAVRLNGSSPAPPEEKG